MRNRIVLAALLMGLLLTGLPGTALESGEESDQPLTPQGMSADISPEESAPAWPFLQALAEQLGISVEELEEAIQGAKDELIDRWAERRASELKERLSQAGPGELLGFMMGRSLARPSQWMMSFSEELQRWRQLGPLGQPRYMQPYYQPYSYNCVCYCNIPGRYFLPSPPQLKPMPQPWKFQKPQPKWPQPEPKQQTPQNP